MVFESYVPAPPLDRFIARFIYYEGYEPPHALDRFLPDGNTELLIDLSDEPQYIYDNVTLKAIQTCRRSWVSGVRTAPITIPSGRGRRMVIVAFRMGKAYPFYPLPMDELADRVVDAEAIFGSGIRELRERLPAAPSIRTMFLAMEEFLRIRASDAMEADVAARCVDYAVGAIVAKPLNATLRRLGDDIGYTRKHFISLFKRAVGVSPKRYLEIARFSRAILDLESAPDLSWTDLAQLRGFYDQSHFIHDFRRFALFTPEEYLRRKTATVNYVPVA